MNKEALALFFLNTAGGDKFTKRREPVGNRSAEEFADQLYEAIGPSVDLLCFAEVPEMGNRKPTGIQRASFLQAIVNRFGTEFLVYPGLDSPMNRQLTTLGLALISRFPLTNIHYLIAEPPVKASNFTHPKGALKGTFEYAGEEVDLAIVHYHPFHILGNDFITSDEELVATNKQLSEFTRFLTPRSNINNNQIPMIVVGDFNTNPSNVPARALHMNMWKVLGYKVEGARDTTVPGATDNRKPDKLYFTSRVTAERVTIFDVHSDHYGIFSKLKITQIGAE